MKSKNVWFAVGTAIGAGALSYTLVRHRRNVMSEGLAWQKGRRPAMDVLACPDCHGTLTSVSFADMDAYHCPTCQKDYPVVDGIPHFIQAEELTGWNKRFAGLYDWFSWGYRAFSKVAFAYIGMSEEQARREITDRLEPKGGRILEVSIGPGVNLPYLVGRPDVGEIFGLDISQGQLNRCREYIAHKGWNIQLQLGNAEQLPYQDNSFDGVFHIGGINFFNNKKKAIEEMIRVAKPGRRILICDENEKGAQAYERFLPSFKRVAGKQRPAVVPPVDLLPPEMEEVRLFEVWKGWMYCIEFRKP
jgi:SAM-dependent methyltransferase